MSNGKKSYSLSTTDAEAFRRLVDAAAGLGSFQMTVVDIKPTPEAKPSPTVPNLRPVDPPSAA